MRINTNVSALRAHRSLSTVEEAVSKSMAKLSSGFRITRSGDDAAGMGIANILRADIRALGQAARNAEQAGSVLNIADGAAGSIQKMLERMKELAAQAASDSVDTAGRSRITAEYQALRAEIDRTVATVKFQGNALLNGAFGASVDAASTVLAAGTGVYAARLNGAGTGTFTLSSAGGVVTLTDGVTSQDLTVTAGAKQTLNFSSFGISIDTDMSVTATSIAGTVVVNGGSGSFLVSSSGQYSTNDQITISGNTLDLRSSTLTIATDPNSLANAQVALAEIDFALTKVNEAVGVIGSLQSRIDTATENVRTTVQNFAAAESTIRDLDMAEEMTQFTKNQILVQAGTAMLAQANQAGQSVLQLLRG